MAYTPQSMRTSNDNVILDAVMERGSLSRADISRYTGLSKPTVSAAVERLIARRLAVETGQADNAQGRKATLVSFNERGHYTCGIDLGATRIRIALCDLSGRLLGYDACPMPADATGEEALALLKSRADYLLSLNEVTWQQLKHICVGVPAVVLPDTSQISRIVAPLAGLQESFALESLSAIFPCEVTIENDVNLAALGEQKQGAAQGVGQFAFFSIGAGTGGGIVVDGRLLKGHDGQAGEFAEMLLPDGSRLETALSAQGLMTLAARVLGERDDEEAKALALHLSPEKLFSAARRGEAAAVETLEAYGRLIAWAVHNLCAVLAPEMVVLGGGIGGRGDLLLPILHRHQAEGLARGTRLVASGLGDRAVVIGASLLARERAVESLRLEL
ncbi:ROK family transcriptional regulator [Paenibacillus pasadenensis]|uniref:ROK family transcriptional regulator n=1 Tax=Paenibacillus TaxID=44249 RepID=UPI000418BFD5|nr:MULTISPECIES: ROK family transcriptional regulator [Paenibacillus]QGG58395.1 ROK family protein [Paenibacillus sp. B01]